MRQVIFTLLLNVSCLFIDTPSVSGQNKPCNNFDCAYKKAENFLKQAAYQKALDNLDSAEGYLTDTNTKEKEQIKQLRRRLFVAIEKEKVKAQDATKEAKRQTELAKNALAQVEIEKQTAVEEKMKAQVAETKAKIVLDKIYFYENKFGLSYDSDTKRFGFIDKELNTKIAFKYEEASPFDYTALAKVKRADIYYLIDTTGKEYQLTNNIQKLDSTITALDLRDQELSEFPKKILDNPQLKILLLNANNIELLPEGISNLSNLILFDLRSNDLKKLPLSIVDLNELIYLDISGNNIQDFPFDIDKLSKLKHLDMSLNFFSVLPENLSNLKFIEYLNLSKNRIKKLPSKFNLFILT